MSGRRMRQWDRLAEYSPALASATGWLIEHPVIMGKRICGTIGPWSNAVAGDAFVRTTLQASTCAMGIPCMFSRVPRCSIENSVRRQMIKEVESCNALALWCNLFVTDRQGCQAPHLDRLRVTADRLRADVDEAGK